VRAAGPGRRHPGSLCRGDRSHCAAERPDADPPAARTVRQHRPLRADRDQPLRRARARLVLERHRDRRAHRHSLRRPGALGDRQGRRGRLPGRADPADRPGGGARLHRRGRRRPGLPARDRARQAVGGRTRPAVRGLAAVPDRVGRAVWRPGRVPERERDRSAYAGHQRVLREVAGRGVANPRAGHRDRRDRRGRGTLVRPAVPVSLVPARGRQVRPHAAAEPGPAAGHRRGRDRGPAAHRQRLGIPVPGAGTGRAFLSMRVAEAVGRGLAGLGADTVFGVVGSGNFHVTNALVAAGARFVAARHEGGAAVMADAWARTTGNVGVVTVHQGPGLTNAMTGIADAAKSRTPLLVLAAEAPEVRSNFHVDVAGLAAAVGAVGERLYSPASALADAHRAYATALGRRTVILALPLNVQGAACEPGPVPALRQAYPTAPAAEAVTALAEVLRGARRPVFIAGRGARGRAAELERLAEACGALLTTSAVAKGLFRGSPWNLDVSGGFATPLAAELIGEADVIAGWGCSLNMWTTRHGKLIPPQATLVQVDDDPAAIGMHRPVHLGVPGDVAETARAVADALGGSPGATGYRSPEV